MSRFVGCVECDWCGRSSFERREALALDGWRYLPPDGDVCFQCAQGITSGPNPLTGYQHDGETPDPVVSENVDSLDGGEA